MPVWTLTQHLFHWGENGCSPLTWKQRITKALDVACGVEYLHSLAQQSFIHRDLKPSNILLGHDMRAKVADFGLVKNVPDGTYSVETQLAGTFGYLAPEYAEKGQKIGKCKPSSCNGFSSEDKHVHTSGELQLDSRHLGHPSLWLVHLVVVYHS